MSGPRKLYIKSYGCQMNVYDSHRMADTMAPQGFVECARPEDADLVVLNTCHIREKAAEKVYSELGRLRRLKAAKPGLRIGVAGCVAQAEGAEIVDVRKGEMPLAPPPDDAGDGPELAPDDGRSGFGDDGRPADAEDDH